MSESTRLNACTAPAHAEPTQWTPTKWVRFSLLLDVFVVLTVFACPEWWRWLLAALLGNHILLGALVLWPRNRLLGANLVTLPRVSKQHGYVALTFDDGPDPNITPRVLDLLDRHGAKASFFCIGRRASAHPEIVRDIIRRGHSVENHSHHHPSAFAFYLPHALQQEIYDAQVAIQAITGTKPQFFRAPMGFRSPMLDPIVVRSALRYVSWTRRGWDCVSRSPAGVLRRIMRGLTAGDVILLHDGSCARTHCGEPVVLAVLPTLLEHLISRGLRPVSLPIALAAP
ncbi:MAG TPA: polysaccharide deacetylase family protein [Acetobacteraceae bacterium]|nr:polysaccharide deacetylase family protein [Acetobacteraceae bacterium]